MRTEIQKSRAPLTRNKDQVTQIGKHGLKNKDKFDKSLENLETWKARKHGTSFQTSYVQRIYCLN